MPQLTPPPIKKAFKFLTIAIISALSLLGVVSIFFMIHVVTTGSHDSHTKQTISRHRLIKLDQAIAEYRLDTGYFPVALIDLAIDSQAPMWMGPYIKEKEVTDPWGKKYHYQFLQHAEGYQLYTLGSDHLVGGSDQKQDQVSNGSLFIIKSD